MGKGKDGELTAIRAGAVFDVYSVVGDSTYSVEWFDPSTLLSHVNIASEQ